MQQCCTDRKSWSVYGVLLKTSDWCSAQTNPSCSIVLADGHGLSGPNCVQKSGKVWGVSEALSHSIHFLCCSSHKPRQEAWVDVTVPTPARKQILTVSVSRKDTSCKKNQAYIEVHICAHIKFCLAPDLVLFTLKTDGLPKPLHQRPSSTAWRLGWPPKSSIGYQPQQTRGESESLGMVASLCLWAALGCNPLGTTVPH